MTENNHFITAIRYRDEAYQLQDLNQPNAALTSARKSLESLVYGLCTENNISTSDPEGIPLKLDALVNLLVEQQIIAGNNIKYVRKIRLNGNNASHVENKRNWTDTKVPAIAKETLQCLSVVLDSLLSLAASPSPAQKIDIAEKYAAAGEITKTEAICQTLLNECKNDTLIQARALCCLCQIGGRYSEKILITQARLDKWAADGKEAAIIATLMQKIARYESLFSFSSVQSIAIGQKVHGYIISKNENGDAVVDFGYMYHGIVSEDLGQFGDKVIGIVKAQTAKGILLECVRLNGGDCFDVCSAINDINSSIKLLQNTGSPHVSIFSQWVEDRSPEYNRAVTLVDLSKAELEKKADENRARAEEKLETETRAKISQERVKAERKEAYKEQQKKMRLYMFAAACLCLLIIAGMKTVKAIHYNLTYKPADLFENLAVSFCLFGDEWIVDMENNSEDAFVQTVQYYIEEGNSFEPGDVVHINASYNTQLAEENKRRVKTDTIRYRVDDYLILVSEPDEISKREKKQIVQNAEDAILSALPDLDLPTFCEQVLVNTSADNLELECANVSACEILLAKEVEWPVLGAAPSKNAIIVIISADLRISDQDEVLYKGAGYFSVAFKNIGHDEKDDLCYEPLNAIVNPLPTLDQIHDAVIQSNSMVYTFEEVPLP